MNLRHLLLALFVWLAAVLTGQAQIPVTGTTPIVENFQTVTTTALPTGWKVSPAGAGASATWSNPANTTSAGSVQSAYNVIPQPGSVVWQPVAGYVQPVHRSIGIYSSAAYPSPNAIMAQFQNKLASSLITSCTISYVPGRRITRTDSQPFSGTSFELFYSTDGNTWTPLPSGNQTSGWNSFYQSAVPSSSAAIGSQTLSATITGVQVPINGSIYFRWQFNTLASGVHWGFSLDDVTFQVTGTAPAQMHWLGDDTTRGGSGTWTATGGTAWTPSDLDGSPGSAWEPARTAQFGGFEPSSVTVSGTVPANLGILFLQSGTILTGDTLVLAGASRAANTLSAADSVTVIIDCDLAGTTGLTKAGDGSLILNRPLSYSGGTDIQSGSVIVAGLGTFTGGIGSLGSGDVAIASGATLLLSNARAIDNAAKLTLATGGRLDLGFNYGIEEAVGSLVLNGVSQPNGTYGATGSGAENINDNFFSGTGLLRVGTPPPVPTSLHWVGNDVSRGGDGIWSNTEPSAWALIDADIPGTLWDATKTAVFGGGEPATVTVVGELAANRGLHFRANASTIEGDPIFLGGATPADNRITVEENVAAALECGLTGSSGLTKDGPGMLVFSSPMAYAGGTIISGGSLAASSNGGLGAGDITLTPSATADSWLILENPDALPDNATIRLNSSASFAGKLNLGFAAGSEERVDALFLNGIAQPPGSYGAAGSGADFVNDSFFSGHGRLRVGEPPPPAPSFQTWATSLGLNSDPEQDIDSDGLSNAMEYVFGTDPKRWNLSPVSYHVGPNQELILSFRRSDAAETPDVTMEVHATPDLEAWPLTFQVASTSISSDSQVTIAENGTADDLVTVVIPNSGGTRLYGRLCVTINAANN